MVDVTTGYCSQRIVFYPGRGKALQSCNLVFGQQIEIRRRHDTIDHLGVYGKEVKFSVIDMKSIGARVKYYRLRNNLSQEELAEKVQISRVHIGNLERGEKLPSMEAFVNLANALNVSADELLADNLLITSSNVHSSGIDVLSDCSANEQKILLENMQALKEILRGYMISK